jgi:putative ribosome biogenesis GTPase RsgA
MAILDIFKRKPSSSKKRPVATNQKEEYVFDHVMIEITPEGNHQYTFEYCDRMKNLGFDDRSIIFDVKKSVFHTSTGSLPPVIANLMDTYVLQMERHLAWANSYDIALRMVLAKADLMNSKDPQGTLFAEHVENEIAAVDYIRDVLNEVLPMLNEDIEKSEATISTYLEQLTDSK